MKKRDSGKLIFAIIIVLVLIFAGVYLTGILNKITGKIIQENTFTIYSSKSSYISQQYPTKSFSSLGTNKQGLGYYGQDGKFRTSSSVHYEYFDLSSIPAGATITSAKLYKYHDTASIGTDTNNLMNPKSIKNTNRVALAKLTETFSEADTYNSIGKKYKAQQITNKIDSTNSTSPKDLVLEYDVKDIIQSWVNGEPNYGFAFLGNYNSAGYGAANYYFRNGASIFYNYRPRLVVEYTNSLCKDYYKGVEFDGFCFTDFERTVIEYPIVENGTLIYTEQNSNVERTVEYPTSIKVLDFGINFNIKIKLNNKGSSEEKIRLNDFKVSVYDMETIDFDEEYTLSPGEKREIEIPVNLPNTNARLGFSKYVVFYDNSVIHILPRINFYWDYNPFSETNVEVLECGNRKYNKNQGACINKILFPAIEGFSCDKDENCLSYDSSIPEFKCFEHSCLVMDGVYNIGSKDKEYRIGILPVYITDDDNQYINMKNEVENHLNNIISRMESWFNEEKLFWNVNNDFEFNYFKINDDCKMSHSEWAEIHPNQGHMSEEELKIIETRCVSNKDYDILIISIQRDDNFPSFAGGGINYQTIIASSLSPRAIIHELLHSFGEHDLYGVESYQWGNCYLYNANTGGDWNIEMPHLCKFEAMQLGWIDKYPN